MAKEVNPKNPTVNQQYIIISRGKGYIDIRIHHGDQTEQLITHVTKAEMDALVIEYNKIKNQL